MINLKTRSYKKELLDSGGIPFEDIKRNMKELNTINTLLGGHTITINGVKNILHSYIRKGDFTKPILIAEIGCGGGDNIKAISKWGKKNNISLKFIGIDILEECIKFAKEQCAAIDADWIVSPYQRVKFNQQPDIIFSSLFCHHFNDEELEYQLKWMSENSKFGFFVNDLHRNSIAYNAIKLLTILFSKSYLIVNDAPLSVARGFTENEWHKILVGAGIYNASIQWKWAFRHLIILKH